MMMRAMPSDGAGVSGLKSPVSVGVGVGAGAGGDASAGRGFPRSFLSSGDLSTGQLRDVLSLATLVKAKPGRYQDALAGKHFALLFEKPSLRTRVSFEVGLTKLGAHAMYFDCANQKIGERESVKDYAKNMERWLDGIVARVFRHEVLEGLREHGAIPVVNALSDREHPCQALADLMTLQERLGTLEGARLAWMGDGNNVCHSLLLTCALLGVSMTVITPKGFEPKFEVVRRALEAAEATGAKIVITGDPAAVAGHHAVYTDCWVSMGQGHQAQLRQEAFAGWRVDGDVMEVASRGLAKPAMFMHCLPAHRGEEVTDEVMDSSVSVVYDQAENRMHAQNALVLKMFGVA